MTKITREFAIRVNEIGARHAALPTNESAQIKKEFHHVIQ
jgi:hypothetical protein